MTARLSIVMMLLTLNNIGFGQQNPCASLLKDANDQYEDGWFDESVKLTNQALDQCELSKRDKVQAYKLLIINYLEIDKLEEANDAAAILMRLEPNYEPDKLRDPAELIMLFEKYRPMPVLRGSVTLGFNRSYARALDVHSVLSNPEEQGMDNYQSYSGFQVGVGVEYTPLNKLWLSLGLHYRNSGYSIEQQDLEGEIVRYDEIINLLDIPVGIKYFFLDGDFKPYFNAGLNITILGSALATISRLEESDIIDRADQRNSLMLGYFAGAGLDYAFKSYSLRLGISYLLVPQQFNQEGTRYDNLEMTFKYYYVDNDFAVDYLMINLGFTYTLAYKNIASKRDR
jgi:outer membrane protein W